MQLEIEMKAWVHNPAMVTTRLQELGAIFIRHYHKEDCYYRTAAPPGQSVRIRVDDQEALVTFKDRQLINGLEVNDEHEFTVSDATIMAELLERLGAGLYVKKVKTGSAWRLGDLLVEISEIQGLGLFIELERIVEVPDFGSTTDREILRQEKSRETESMIRQTLAQLAITEADIEFRPYTAMLLAQK